MLCVEPIDVFFSLNQWWVKKCIDFSSLTMFIMAYKHYTCWKCLFSPFYWFLLSQQLWQILHSVSANTVRPAVIAIPALLIDLSWSKSYGSSNRPWLTQHDFFKLGLTFKLRPTAQIHSHRTRHTNSWYPHGCTHRFVCIWMCICAIMCVALTHSQKL